MPCFPLAFVFSLPHSPLMTLTPLGMVCPCPSFFSGPHTSIQFAALVQTSSVLKWLFTCWCSSRAPLFVISAAESCSPFRHCLSSAPALTPSWASLLIIMANPFGVTHVFATSPTCPSSSWGFGHLHELQMEFPPLPSKSFDDTKFQESCLSLSIPAINYTPFLLLLCFCLLV